MALVGVESKIERMKRGGGKNYDTCLVIVRTIRISGMD